MNGKQGKISRLFGFIRNVTLSFINPHTILYSYKMLVLPILTYCITILWCPETNITLKELVAIEHKFLKYASSKTINPMHYFDHVYTQIWALLKIESLRSQIRKIDYLVAFKIAHKLYRSDDVNTLFVKRTVKHNLRNYREILKSALYRDLHATVGSSELPERKHFSYRFIK